MKIVVLSDKKPGHYNQSLGIVQNIPECQTEWLEIQYTQKWRDNILRIFMSVCGGITLPTTIIHSLLQWSLDTSSYDALIKIQGCECNSIHRIISRRNQYTSQQNLTCKNSYMWQTLPYRYQTF